MGGCNKLAERGVEEKENKFFVMSLKLERTTKILE